MVVPRLATGRPSAFTLATVPFAPPQAEAEVKHGPQVPCHRAQDTYPAICALDPGNGYLLDFTAPSPRYHQEFGVEEPALVVHL